MFSASLKTAIYLIVTICVASLGANAFLAWQWQSERAALRELISSKNTQLQLTSLKSRRLSRENKGLQADVVEKDQELNAKLTELAKKQAELDQLSKEFESKKKEVDAKQKELDAKNGELTAAQKQINDQKSQLDANASELSKLRNRPPLFSFQVKSTSIADVEAKKEAVKQVVTAASDIIEEIYSKPYLLHSVTITFVDAFSNDKASGEIVITNSNEGLDIDIRIKDFDRNSFADVNTIIHEVVHSFHGLAVLEPSAFEEGIAVAVTDAVMKKMIAAGSIPSFSPLYIRISESDFQAKQSSLSIPRNSSSFYGSDQVTDFYQVLGKAWYKLYEQDSGFFKKFNEKLYAKKQQGQEITEPLVLDTIREVLPGVSLTGAAWQLK